MNELAYWTETLNARAGELGLDKTVRPVQPGEGDGYAVHWVIEMGDRLMELGWNVEEAERNLRMLATQTQLNA